MRHRFRLSYTAFILSLLLWSGWIPTPECRAADGKEVTLASGQDPAQPKQPQPFVSADGVIDIVWATANEIRLTTSRDNGDSFQTAVGVITCPNLAAGMRRGPRVVRVGTSVVVSAIGGKIGKGKDGDLMTWHSSDNGVTWSAPVLANSVADAAREGLHAMTATADGNVWCTWLDLRNKRTQILAASSGDAGKTWSDNELVYESPDSSVCECCHPTIVAGSDGTIQVMFRNSLGGDRDMFLVTRNANGKLLPAKLLGTGHWKLDACPMDGGMLAVDRAGKVITVWRREGRIFASTDDGSPETLLGNGQQPWVAATLAGPIFAWTRGRDGILVLQTGINGKPRELSAAARDAVVVAMPGGQSAIVCWEAKSGPVTKLVARRIATPATTTASGK